MWHETTRCSQSRPWQPFPLPLTVALLVAAGLLGGCAQKEQPQFEPTRQPVAWNQLTDAPGVSATNEVRLNVAGETRGLFPTSIAVARVASSDNLEASQSPLVLDSHPEVDYLAWNSLFDDLRPVGEVFPLDHNALNGQPATPETIRHAAVSLQAGLVLLYTENQQAPGRAEMRGVLFDSRTGVPLAACHQSAVVENPIAVGERETEGESPAMRERRDPRLVSLYGFKKHVRSAVLALMNNDQPADTVAPEGWIPDRVIQPLIWPPDIEQYLPRRP